MHKILLIAALILLPFISKSYAVTFTLYDMCENRINHEEKISIMLPSTVGDITLFILKIHNIKFVGDETGIKSIWGSPIGRDAIEIMGPNHYRVYGWCYSVDGVEPDVLMNKFPIQPDLDQHIEWYFGYGESLNGEWLSYCTPTHINPTDFLCKD